MGSSANSQIIAGGGGVALPGDYGACVGAASPGGGGRAEGRGHRERASRGGK